MQSGAGSTIHSLLRAWRSGTGADFIWPNTRLIEEIGAGSGCVCDRQMTLIASFPKDLLEPRVALPRYMTRQVPTVLE